MNLETQPSLGRIAPLLLLLTADVAHGQEPRPEADMRGLIVNEPGASGGYTLIAPLTSTSLYLIDRNAEVVQRWEPETQTECAILTDDGHLLRWCMIEDDERPFQGPGVGGGLIEKMAWSGEVVWRYVVDDERRLCHHDIALLPNGNVLVLAWERKTRDEAIAAGRDPAQVDGRGMWPDCLFEVRPILPEGGEIVWEWHVWDHLVQDHDRTKSNYGSVPEAVGRVDINADHRDQPPLTAAEIAQLEEIEEQMAALGYGGDDDDDDDDEEQQRPRRRNSAPDWLHTNAVDYLPEHDLIVLSTPALNELWVIDHSTTTEEAAGSSGGRWGHGGDLLWRWGNPRNYGAGHDRDQQLSFQHDPTWLAPAETGELRLLVFNNGRVRPGESYSSADELVLPFDPEHGFVRAEDQAYGPAAPTWSYSDPGTFYSSFISGAQRLPNGNTLICSGAQGRVFEVTRDGAVVWDYRNPLVGEIDHGIPVNALYRAVRFSEDHSGLAGRDL